MEITLVIKRVVLAILVLWLAAVTFSKITSYYASSITPNFLEEMEKGIMHSPSVRAKIGEQVGFESNYNENDLQTDTVKFKVKVQGATGQLLMTGYALKKGDNWVPVRIDSAYQDN